MAKQEAVDSPSHYGGKDNPFEVIKVLEDWLTREQFIGFCRGNALKYLARAGKKDIDTTREDLAKAKWYIEYEKVFRSGTEIIKPPEGLTPHNPNIGY